jgi:hypothetical protein
MSSFRKMTNEGGPAVASPAVSTSPRAPDRPDPREEDPRARAARRAAEIREHSGGIDEGTDKFYIPPHVIPDGWTYEWKTLTVLNAENPAHQVELARRGWEPVPASRHPEMMPHDWKAKIITRDGMMLMERPKEITDEALSARLRRARLQVRAKEEQLSAAPAGQFERANKDSSLVKVKRNYEAMPIPEE